MLKTPDQEIAQLLNSRAGRRALAQHDFHWFLTIYFPHYLEYESPDFHQEIISLITNPKPSFVAITAFRGSAKSTLCALALPLWEVICTNRKHLVVIVCQNQSRASQSLSNIRLECETNELLINDFGPFLTPQNLEWSTTSLVFAKQQARITAASVSESVRGMRHKEHRPDLLIADDIEDVQSAKVREQRDKLWEFVNGELIPLGTPKTSYIFIGNLVHQDSVMMRLRQSIQSGKRIGIYREYPLISTNGNCVWPAKYPTKEAIQKLEGSLTENDYAREYLLKAINTNEQIIKPSWIQYYDKLPDDKYLSYHIIAVDPAFSTSKEADKSAIIIASMYRLNRNEKYMYIHPEPLNGKWNNPSLVELIDSTYKSMGGRHTVKIIVEQAGQQIMLIDQLQSLGLPVEGLAIKGADKATRLWSASTQVKKGAVLFPKQGCKQLIEQILFFGSERYDDLVDSFTLACSKHRQYMTESEPMIGWI